MLRTRGEPYTRDLRSASVFEEGERGATPLQQEFQADPDANYRPEFYAKSGFYFTGRGHWSDLGGDFNGDTTLVGPDTIFHPEANEGYGYEVRPGLALGRLGDGVHVQQHRLRRDDRALDAETQIEAVNWNFVRYLRGNEELQPYWMLGLTFPWADLKNASTDGVVVGDASCAAASGFDSASDSRMASRYNLARSTCAARTPTSSSTRRAWRTTPSRSTAGSTRRPSASASA
jgi:hypothetical protein